MPVAFNPVHSEFHIRDKDSFNHAQEISKPHGVIDEVLEWSKAELRHEWRWQLVDLSTQYRNGRYIFYFDSEKDCLAFTLKWS